MKKLILITIFALFLTGCGEAPEGVRRNKIYNITCYSNGTQVIKVESATNVSQYRGATEYTVDGKFYSTTTDCTVSEK